MPPTNDASKLKAIEEIDSSVLCVGLLDAARAMNSQAKEQAAQSSAPADIDPELKAKIDAQYKN